MNHIIDPTYFNDLINMFGFNYDAYIVVGIERDDYGIQKSKFNKMNIFGSLQTQGLRKVQRNDGNYTVESYKFYCSSLYRLNEGDFIQYQNKLLHITAVFSYDEYGVREVDLERTQLDNHRDLQEFVKFISGDKIV